MPLTDRQRKKPSSRTRLVALAFFCVSTLGPFDVRADFAGTQQSALGWLSSNQRADGSWGAEEDLRLLYTAESVSAFQSANQRTTPYFRGATWLENHAVSNLDFVSRRIVALAARGDSFHDDVVVLNAAFRPEGGASGGWGVSGGYEPAALDTALVLMAYAALQDYGSADAGLQLLLDEQLADGGWPPFPGRAGSDPITAALVLRALLIHQPTTALPLAQAISDAVAYLVGGVSTSSTELQRAHAALALYRADPASAQGQLLMQSLDSDQDIGGSWGQDPYVTAAAVQAFSAALGSDDPALAAFVRIEDHALRAALNGLFARNAGDGISRAQLQNLATLDLSSLGIESVVGLEEATQLTFLDLRHNAIESVAPVAGLLGQTTVYLYGNPALGPCDLSSDGEIGPEDAMLGLRLVDGSRPLTMLDLAKADIAPPSSEGDGAVLVNDALLLMRASNGVAIAGCAP